MNHSELSPIGKINPHEKWHRFNSLPFKIQEGIVKLLVMARDDGLLPIIAREKLNRLHGMTDAEIINSYNTFLEQQPHANCNS
jgi:hypothetical protein